VKTPLFLHYNIYKVVTKYIIMKDIYKQRADDTIESLISRTKIVKEMVSGDRPADTKQAELYLKEVLYGLEKLQEIVHLG
jgi:hypothetical protein